MGIKLSKARCRALVISCSDFRFVSVQRQARIDLGLNNAYDLIARPGGVRQIVLPTSEAARQTMDELAEHVSLSQSPCWRRVRPTPICSCPP